jgi:predicted transcriptional regulator
MTIKEKAKSVIDNLPEDSTMDDIMHALYIQAKLEKGLQEINEGKGISHEVVKERLLNKWAR